MTVVSQRRSLGCLGTDNGPGSFSPAPLLIILKGSVRLIRRDVGMLMLCAE